LYEYKFKKGIIIMNWDWNYRPAVFSLAIRKELIGLEIGVDKGWNSYNMLNNLDIKKLYLIDPYFPQNEELDADGERSYVKGEYRPEKEIAENVLKPFKDKIIWKIGTTEEMIHNIPDGSLDFCYIDGDHKYESVKKDIELSYPKVKVGSVIGGHDFCNAHPGIVKAVIEFFGQDIFVANIDWWHIKVV
jgi:hypothetical protein